MRATNAAGMIMDGFVPSKTRSTRRVGYAASVNYFLSLWGLAVLLTCSFGCGPSSSVGDGRQSTSSSPSNDRPELTDDVIRDRINHTRVREIPEENGTAEPISWRFDEEEPKEIKVVEKQVEGNRASIILDIKTESSPKARDPRSRPRYLAGQIRTEWELQTGWLLRKWEIVEAKNISMKFRNLTNPPEQNSNR